MTQDKNSQVIEGNREIALCMEGKTEKDKEYINSRVNSYFLGVLCYHKEWSLLMPVFLKVGTMWHWQIEKFGCKIQLLDETIEYKLRGKDSNSEEKLKQCVWLAAVDFANWYNKQKS